MLRHELTDSAVQSPVDATTSPEPLSKKRKATYSARGVATLTPEQLAKKRANDREAQRAIRERTKAQIETLERRIQELTSQQPYQELQTVLRQKDAIQAENDEIRRRLASVLSIIQPIVGAQGLTGDSILPPPKFPLLTQQQISLLQRKATSRTVTLTSKTDPSIAGPTSMVMRNSISRSLSPQTCQQLRRQQNPRITSNHIPHLIMNGNGRHTTPLISKETPYSEDLN